MWIIFAFASAFFAGITAILAKCGMKEINSNIATFLRTGVVLVFAWILVFATGAFPQIWDITLKSLVFLVLSGVTTGASWLCYFKALQLGDINKVTPVDKCSTIITMLLAAAFLKEPLNWIKVLSMVLIGTGTFFMIQKQKSAKKTAESNQYDDIAAVPDKQSESVSDSDEKKEKSDIDEKQKKSHGGKMWFLFATGSAVFAALTAVLGKIGIQDVNSNLGTAIRTIVVLVMAWQVVLVTGNKVEIRSLNWTNIVFLVLSGCATGGSWLCYYHALQTGPASVVVPIDKLSVLVTVLFSRLVFKETMEKKAWLGLGLLVLGTLLLLTPPGTM